MRIDLAMPCSPKVVNVIAIRILPGACKALVIIQSRHGARALLRSHGSLEQHFVACRHTHSAAPGHEQVNPTQHSVVGLRT